MSGAYYLVGSWTCKICVNCNRHSVWIIWIDKREIDIPQLWWFFLLNIVAYWKVYPGCTPSPGRLISVSQPPNPPSLSAGVARKEIDHGNPWTLPLVTIRFRSGAIVALLNVNQKNCSHWQGRPDVPLWYENALGHLPYFPAFLRISRQWSTDFMAMRVYAMAPWW